MHFLLHSSMSPLGKEKQIIGEEETKNNLTHFLSLELLSSDFTPEWRDEAFF